MNSLIIVPRHDNEAHLYSAGRFMLNTSIWSDRRRKHLLLSKWCEVNWQHSLYSDNDVPLTITKQTKRTKKLRFFK